MKPPRRILAVDTTGEGVELALGDGLAEPLCARGRGRRQDEALFPCLERLLARAGIGLEALDAVAGAVGPGRFTGIRVGLTFAEMLARSLAVPAAGVTLFEAAAALMPASAQTRRLYVDLEGWRGERFLQAFRLDARGTRPLGPPAWYPGPREAEAARAALGCGGQEWGLKRPGPRGVLAAARLKLAAGKPSPLRPLYLKQANYERLKLGH